MRALAAVVLLGGIARAEPPPDPRQLYREGKEAYELNDLEGAYDAWKRAFLISNEPAILYNIATVLERLKRPHDAAEALRSYLRARPADPDREAIATKINTLEEAQHLIDLDKAPAPSPDPIATVPPATAPPAVAPAPITAPAPPPAWPLRKRVAIGVGVAGGVALVLGLSVGLGVAYGGTTAPLDPTQFGPVQGTR